MKTVLRLADPDVDPVAKDVGLALWGSLVRSIIKSVDQYSRKDPYVHVTDIVYSKKDSFSKQRYLLDGIFKHMKWANILSNCESVISNEASVEYEGVLCTPDFVLNINNHKVVLDIKSVSPRMFSRILSGFTPKYHLNQVQWYIWATGADIGFLLYEDRDTLEIVLVPVLKDPERMEVLKREKEAFMAGVRDSCEEPDS